MGQVLTAVCFRELGRWVLARFSKDPSKPLRVSLLKLFVFVSCVYALDIAGAATLH